MTNFQSFISRFTPSLMSADDLKRMFVQRNALLDDLKQGLNESITTESKHHYLLVGPRGIGKTHMMSLLYYELCELQSSEPCIIAWLREEEYVSSFLDLLVRILQVVRQHQPDLISESKLEESYGMDNVEAEEYLQSALEELLTNRPLILLAENLQDIFDAIGDEGQRKLRALIQQSNRVSFVASTPSLFASVSLQTSPFYGFFEIERLTELTMLEAKELLSRLAEHDGNNALAAFMQTSAGAAKVEAIYHLAGGNHRVYIILSQFITGQSIEDIVKPFIEMLDDLTPYYQAQLSLLSPQQRKIVQLLCDRKYAVAVKEIAARCFITPQTASSQLKELREREFVKSVQVGRESRYELREPLLRFCMELKQTRGEPVRILVEFLQTWYSTRDINLLLEQGGASFGMSRTYLRKALEQPSRARKPSGAKAQELRTLELEQSELAHARKFGELLEVQKEIVSKRGTAEDHLKLGYCHALLNQMQIALGSFEQALRVDPYNWDGLRYKQMALLKLGRIAEAIELANFIVRKNRQDAEAWDLLGIAHISIGNAKEALKAFERSVELNPKNSAVRTRVAATWITLKQYDTALEKLDDALSLDQTNVQALVLKGMLLGSLTRERDALPILNKAIQVDPSEPQAWLGKAMVLMNLDRYDESLKCVENAMDLDRHLVIAQFWRATSLFALGRSHEYRKEMVALLKRCHRHPNEAIADFGAVLRLLLERFSDAALWRAELKTLFDECLHYELLSKLSTSVANTIPSLISKEVSDQSAVDWVGVCDSLFSGTPEFKITLRLLKTALAFRRTEDIDVALELASEERVLFLQLVELHDAVHRFAAVAHTNSLLQVPTQRSKLAQ